MTKDDIVTARMTMRDAGHFIDAVVISVEREGQNYRVGWLDADAVRRGWGGLEYITVPTTAAMHLRTGTLIRIWVRRGYLVHGVTLREAPTADAVARHVRKTSSLPDAVEGEHIWWRDA